MTVFVDTSAFYSVLDRGDRDHPKAIRVWNELLDQDAILLTHNYILLETGALVQHRLGLAAVRAFDHEVVPRLTIEWISEEAHAQGVEALLTAARRSLSLVACISFQTMRQRGVGTAFCFDRHFREQGFTVLP